MRSGDPDARPSCGDASPTARAEAGGRTLTPGGGGAPSPRVTVWHPARLGQRPPPPPREPWGTGPAPGVPRARPQHCSLGGRAALDAVPGAHQCCAPCPGQRQPTLAGDAPAHGVPRPRGAPGPPGIPLASGPAVPEVPGPYRPHMAGAWRSQAADDIETGEDDSRCTWRAQPTR